MDGITQQICNFKVNGNSKTFKEEKNHLHVLGPAQNEYFVSSIPFFFWGPLSLSIFTTRIFLYPSVKMQHENQTGLLCPFLTVLLLKVGFAHCSFQSWKGSVTSSQIEPALRGICCSCLPLSSFLHRASSEEI